jgi:hypothetical protein
MPFHPFQFQQPHANQMEQAVFEALSRDVQHLTGVEAMQFAGMAVFASTCANRSPPLLNELQQGNQIIRQIFRAHDNYSFVGVIIPLVYWIILSSANPI